VKSKTIAKIIRNDEGVSVTVYDAETVDIMIGIAETIQMISEQSEKDIRLIMSDINKILAVLEEQEKKGGKENE